MSEKRNVPELRFPDYDRSFELQKLSIVANVFDGTHQTPKYTTSGVPFVSVENIRNLKATDKFISPEAFEKDFKTRPRKGDILMTRITAGVIGDTAIVEDSLPLGYYVSLALIRTKGETNIRFLNYALATNHFKRELNRRIIHVAFPKKINLGEIGDCTLPVAPSLPEQQKIAEFLTAVDKRIELLQTKKKKLEAYKKGVMQKIFTQQLRFKADDGSEFPDWEERKLGDLGSVYQPKTISQSDLTNEGYDVFGANGIIGKYHSYNHEFSQVAVTCRGNTCGTINWTNPKSWITGNAMVVNTDESPSVNKRFLFYILTFSDLKYLITGSGQPQITGDLKNHKIQLPILEEQQKIVAFLTRLDSTLDNLNQQINQTQTWKKGLLQKMFV